MKKNQRSPEMEMIQNLRNRTLVRKCMKMKQHHDPVEELAMAKMTIEELYHERKLMLRELEEAQNKTHTTKHIDIDTSIEESDIITGNEAIAEKLCSIVHDVDSKIRQLGLLCESITDDDDISRDVKNVVKRLLNALDVVDDDLHTR